MSGILDGVDSSGLRKTLEAHSDWLTDKIRQDSDGMTEAIARSVVETMKEVKAAVLEVLETADNAAFQAAFQWSRPSVMFRPRLIRHGGKWWALYGDDHVNGVFGCGDTPHRAMSEFNESWENESADWSNSTPVPDAPFHVKAVCHE